MFGRRIIIQIPQPNSLIRLALNFSHSHTKTCPVTKTQIKRCPGAGGIKKPQKVVLARGPVCPKKKDGDSGSGDDDSGGLKRRKTPGKVRMGLIPEEWFTFLRPMTGVTGPYILMIGLGNYVVSKEIFVMEHEYYLGLSIAIVLYFVTTRLGPLVGSTLDKEVDSIANELEQSRQNELAGHDKNIKAAETAIWRAQGQQELMAAKKENIAIQLEAIYRERLMMVFQRVKGRLDYHARRHKVENRIRQKWMIKWVLESVEKSITPDFKRQALDKAIADLSVIATRTRK